VLILDMVGGRAAAGVDPAGAKRLPPARRQRGRKTFSCVNNRLEGNARATISAMLEAAAL